jgi:translation initiation factor IF-1
MLESTMSSMRDAVLVDVSVYDINRGRIVVRYR